MNEIVDVLVAYPAVVETSGHEERLMRSGVCQSEVKLQTCYVVRDGIGWVCMGIFRPCGVGSVRDSYLAGAPHPKCRRILTALTFKGLLILLGTLGESAWRVG